ncbi:MAG TPA: ArsB/NhaD family transporter [Polyangia bacterium]|nr:ArsB/NhaD family transporter [Polyangia bacterium]
MPPSLRAAATLILFAATLALVLRRPRGWNEAWWAMGGAALMMALGLVRAPEAADTLSRGKDALLMLLALLCLSAVVARSGFFEWAAIVSARRARGDAAALFRNTFVLGALVTIVLSLDTTAVILTPIVIAGARRMGLPARPHVLLCAIVSNCASLLLPVSNLTNLLFVSAFRMPFAPFVARMLLPQAVVLLVTYAILRRLFRAELRRDFDTGQLPAAASAIADPPLFRASCLVLVLVSLGYFVGPPLGVPVYVVAFAGALALAVYTAARTGLARAASWRWLGDVPFGAAGLAAGLFVVVRGVENLGLARLLVPAVERLASRSLWLSLPATAGATAVASNAVNNLPAALAARSILQQAHAPGPLVLAALIGADVGPNITIVGSLATVLVLTVARARGESVGGRDLLRAGGLVTPAALLAAALALAATYHS